LCAMYLRGAPGYGTLHPDASLRHQLRTNTEHVVAVPLITLFLLALWAG
jgi:hypothetical protein